MSDRRVRDLHRRWLASGSLDDEAAWLAMRARAGDPYRFGPLTTRSPAMRATLAACEAASRSDRPVVLLGEAASRQGLARAVHDAGDRRDGPFAREDLRLPETLQEQELFGYVRSSCFGGGVAVRAGLIERADGGTLSLEVDEVGELVRSKLKRVIAARETRRIGAREPTPVDVRLVFEVREAAMLGDLLDGLGALTISVPSLAERPEDVASTASDPL